MVVKKRVKTRFIKLTTAQNVFFVVQTTGQNFWCSPEYIIRITHEFRIIYSGKIRLWREPKGNLGLCVW